LRIFRGHTDAVGSLAFTPDGKSLASASNDGTTRIWDVLTGKPRAILLNPFFAGRPENGRDRAESVVLTPDGKTLLWGSYDGTIQITALPTLSGQKVTRDPAT